MTTGTARSAAAFVAVVALVLSCAQAEEFVDPNRQTEGFQASLTVDKLAGNPLGLVSAVAQNEGMDLPNAGVTFSSQHNAEVSADAENLWTWEFDGYNVENVGLTTVHNLKDPRWPVVMTLFESTSSPDFLPIVTGELHKNDLIALATGLVDATGKSLGYKDIYAATNASALGVVSRMASDPTQAIFGVLGNDLAASELNGGVNMPVDDETYIPLTDEQIAELPDPKSLKPESSSTDAAPATPTATPSVVTATPSPVTATPSPVTAAPTTAAATPNPAAAPSPAPTPAPAPAPKSSAEAVKAGMLLVCTMLAGVAMLF